MHLFYWHQLKEENQTKIKGNHVKNIFDRLTIKRGALWNLKPCILLLWIIGLSALGLLNIVYD